MIIRGVVEKIENDQITILLGEEGLTMNLPRSLMPDVGENDMLSFTIKREFTANEVRKMSPKNLLDLLSRQT